jgi:hypothetical protein
VFPGSKELVEDLGARRNLKCEVNQELIELKL